MVVNKKPKSSKPKPKPKLSKPKSRASPQKKNDSFQKTLERARRLLKKLGSKYGTFSMGNTNNKKRTNYPVAGMLAPYRKGLNSAYVGPRFNTSFGMGETHKPEIVSVPVVGVYRYPAAGMLAPYREGLDDSYVGKRFNVSMGHVHKKKKSVRKNKKKTS